ncbi:MAG TPA: radical SAM/SPASM domain-containing protein [Candidatus Limnocylindrales bacterium]|nr:radical SAM/SPASM domain-containing protein [Candidatus Limnocylindrales bacterium]
MSQVVFNSLVLETVDRCNARCAMCYQAAAPKGSEIRGDDHLPLDLVNRIIDEAAELPELMGDRVHISGGESFLFFDETVQIFKRAKARHFGNIGGTTNAFWALSDAIADRRCEELAQAGVTYLEVSIDHWHKPYVTADRVRCLLRAMRRTGLPVTLRTLSSRSHHIDDVLEDFEDQELLQVIVGNGRVQPVGRGARTIPMSEVYIGGGVQGCCERQLNLTISPNGNVYPCCAGADMTESLACGNIYRDSLAEAVLKMRTEAVIREVIHGGTGKLIPIIEQLGYGDRLLPQYTSICHLCWDVFRQDDVAGALRQHYQDKQFEALVSALSSSVDEPPLDAP